MIKALLLIFCPVATWEQIVADRRRWSGLFWAYLLPLLFLVSLVEGYGLMRWGKARLVQLAPRPLPLSEALVFETVQILLSVSVVFVGAVLVKMLAETFRNRQSFNQAFTLTVYGLSPVFVLRLFNVFPLSSPWIFWADWILGVILAFWILYWGLPRVMKPDPSHAFGLYLVSTLLLAMISGISQLLASAYLQGRLGRLAGLDELVARCVS
jgi:hypothetical protein